MYRLGSDGKPADAAGEGANLKKLLADIKNGDVDSPVYQLVEGFPDIQHMKTDVFREQVEYSARIKDELAAAEELARRLTLIFLKDDQGRRPVYGGTRKFQEDPHWQDLLLFYEYFHGDNGAGLGASHQTGWTGVIARVMHLFATSTAEEVLKLGQKAVVAETESEWGPQLMRRS